MYRFSNYSVSWTKYGEMERRWHKRWISGQNVRHWAIHCCTFIPSSSIESAFTWQQRFDDRARVFSLINFRSWQSRNNKGFNEKLWYVYSFLMKSRWKEILSKMQVFSNTWRSCFTDRWEQNFENLIFHQLSLKRIFLNRHNEYDIFKKFPFARMIAFCK